MTSKEFSRLTKMNRHDINDKRQVIGLLAFLTIQHLSRRCLMPEAIISKVCSKCQVEKPVSEFHRCTSSKHGVQSQCISCRKKIWAKPQAQQVRNEKKVFMGKGLKKCSKCHNIKEVSEFYSVNHHADRLTSSCKSCEMQYRKDNRVKRQKYAKSFYVNNKEKIKDSTKTYRKSLNGKKSHLKCNHKYRALKRNATIEIFNPFDVFERDKYICQICKRKTRPDFKPNHSLYPTLDHIIPLSNGGEHSVKNTQCLCLHCNCSKQDKDNFGDQLRLF